MAFSFWSFGFGADQRGTGCSVNRLRTARALREEGDGTVANLAMPLAAVSHQKGDEIGQGWEDGAVDDRAALPATLDKAGVFKMAQVERKAGRRASDRFTNGSCGHAASTSDHEPPDNAEPRLLRDGAESFENALFLHIVSTDVEISAW